ncbi:MAG: ATP-binding protein [Haloarculaceae archaeon]
MELSKRTWLGLTTVLSLVLTGIVVRDILIDWGLENKSLWSTLAENAIPAALAITIAATGYTVYVSRDKQYMRTLTTWQYLGATGILVIALEVVGLQVIQGELKPQLIVSQMTVGGAIAGTLVGYANARSGEARQTIEAERDKFGALFENTPSEGAEVEVVGDDVLIREPNSSFEQTFDFNSDAGANRRLFETVTHDSELQNEIRRQIVAGEEFEAELHTATARGPRDFRLRVVPFDDNQAYLLYTDVTELQQTKAELKDTIDRLEQSNQRLQQFAYVASHDLQEPARMVSSYVTLLDREYRDDLDAEAAEYMEFAIDGAERMQDMIDALLDYSRVRTDAAAFTETNAEEVYSETLADLGLLIDEHDVTVNADDLPTVEADRNQLGQLLQNLIENAIQHGGSEIHIGATQHEDEVVFSVSDDGPGIPDSQQERIFEIFEQGSRDDEGTGIGLAICDRIVSRHDGEMWVESTEGEGTTFYFSIPG